MRIPGFTSTGSKAPAALFGPVGGGPGRMTRAEGCRVWDEDGREYLDLIMGLGAVGLGYGHPMVTEAVSRACTNGVVGPLSPLAEQRLAEELGEVVPDNWSIRFLKSGAEAVSAAVRLARVQTGRDRILTCGYQGWLDTFQMGTGIPKAVSDLRTELPFNDSRALKEALRRDETPAAIVVEPVVDGEPRAEWLGELRQAADQSGACLIFDEIKTGFRIALGGAAEHYGVTPDLMVFGKALANGFPLAAVTGEPQLLDCVERTWISSTLATEYVSLEAARAVLRVYRERQVIDHLEQTGLRLWQGLEELAARYSNVVAEVKGIPQMCYLSFGDDYTSALVAAKAAQQGVIFKRSAYNFVSLAHRSEELGEILERLDRALDEVERTC